MDQKHMDKIDIERCKELFEYEMTEVVLMLKGEFAAVSGKDLGLPQYRISDEKRNAYKSVSPIPTIEVQPVAIPKTLRDKPVSPNLSIQTDPVKLDISVPAQKQFQYSGVMPQIQVEALCQLDIPHPSRTSFPRRAPVSCTAAQIVVSAIQDAPRMNIPPADTTPVAVEIPKVAFFAQTTKPIATIPESITPDEITIPEVPALSIPTVVLSPKTIDVPKIRKVSAPNLRQTPVENPAKDTVAAILAEAQIAISAIQEAPRMNMPPVDASPVTVEVPKVASFAQATKSISTILESNATEKITIPDVLALSIPVVALSPKNIDVPIIRKVSAPNLRQAPEEYSARDIIATMVADAEKLCTNLPNIDFSSITKREIKTAVHFFEPVKRVTVRPACATIDAPAQPLAVPDIPRLEAMQSIAMGEMKGLSDAIIQAMHDLKKELDDM